MRATRVLVPLSLVLAVACGSSSKSATAPVVAPTSVRTVTVTPSPTAAGLDANARITCAHYDDAVTHDAASTKESGSYILTGTGNDGLADGVAALEAWEVGVVAGSKSVTPAIHQLADAQLLKDPSKDPTAFTAALLAMRDACIGAGWASTSTGS